MFLSEWCEFPSVPSLAGEKNLMTARVSMFLKSRASLTCFRDCFLPRRAKDLSAPRYINSDQYCIHIVSVMHIIELSLTENAGPSGHAV